MGLHVISEATGDLAFVEGVGAVVGDLLQRPGKVGLPEDLAGPEEFAARLVEGTLPSGALSHPLLGPAEDEGLVRRQNDPLRRQPPGRHDHVLPGQPAIPLVRQSQARHRAGYGRGPVAAGGLGRLLALAVDEHVQPRRRRRDRAEVDDDGLPRPGNMDQHEAIAADIARPRQCDRKDEAYGDSGIDGVTTLAQDLGPDHGGDGVLGDHHAPLAHHRMVDGGVLEQLTTLRLGLSHRRERQGEGREGRQPEPDHGHGSDIAGGLVDLDVNLVLPTGHHGRDGEVTGVVGHRPDHVEDAIEGQDEAHQDGGLLR